MGSAGQSGQQDLGAGWANLSSSDPNLNGSMGAAPANSQWNGQGTSPSFMSSMTQPINVTGQYPVSVAQTAPQATVPANTTPSWMQMIANAPPPPSMQPAAPTMTQAQAVNNNGALGNTLNSYGTPTPMPVTAYPSGTSAFTPANVSPANPWAMTEGQALNSNGALGRILNGISGQAPTQEVPQSNTGVNLMNSMTLAPPPTPAPVPQPQGAVAAQTLGTGTRPITHMPASPANRDAISKLNVLWNQSRGYR